MVNELVNMDFQEVFQNACTFAKTDNELEFKSLFRDVKREVFPRLINYRKEVEWDFKPEQLQTIIDKFIKITAPVFLISFGGYLSHNEKYNIQEELLVDLLTIDGWNSPSGRFCSDIQKIPQMLAYMLHHVHGALYVYDNKIMQITKALEYQIPNFNEETGTSNEYDFLYKIRSVIVRFNNFMSPFESFKFLLDAFPRWEWLKFLPFKTAEEFKKNLVTYQMISHLLNYFYLLKTNSVELENSMLSSNVLPSFAKVEEKSWAHAFVMRNRSFFKSYLEEEGLSTEMAINKWELWEQKLNIMLPPFSGFSAFEPNFIRQLLN